MFVPYYLHKFLKLYISQTKKCLKSCFLLLIFILWGFLLLLIVPLQGPLQEFSLECLVGSSFIQKRRKISWNDQSLWLAVVHCHWLSLVVTRCTTGCHSFSLVIIRCIIQCHSLPLDVSLVCLFMNDLFIKLQGLLH